MRNFLVCLFMVVMVVACNQKTEPPADPPAGDVTVEPAPSPSKYEFRWDSPEKTKVLVRSIQDAKFLMTVKPKDWQEYTDKWPENTRELIQFWGNILVEISYYESKWDGSKSYKEAFRNSQGERIYSRGLFQLSRESGRGYGCSFFEEADLHKDHLNISCAVVILDRWVGRDKVIDGGYSGNWKGGARYWAVLRGFNSYTKKALKGIKDANKP